MDAKMLSAHVDAYTDRQGLNDLKRLARNDQSKALRQVAQQFEALFMQMMLKSMRDASMGDDLFSSSQSQTYRDLYDRQLSLDLSKGHNKLGLAEMIVQQMTKTMPEKGPAKDDPVEVSAQPARPSLPAVSLRVTDRAHLQQQSRSVSVPVNAVKPKPHWAVANDPVTTAENTDSPRGFVAAIWQEVKQAARELGVNPKGVLAQAILESGWGKHVMRQHDGESSHNLFGIKADSRWQGDRVAANTLEYRQGELTRERARFRAYGSVAEGLKDYVAFLKNSRRYQQALKAGDDPVRYAAELQKAGYATDPHYADKVKRIVNSSRFKQATEGLF